MSPGFQKEELGIRCKSLTISLAVGMLLPLHMQKLLFSHIHFGSSVRDSTQPSSPTPWFSFHLLALSQGTCTKFLSSLRVMV